MSSLIDQIRQLSIAEKIQLVQEVWDDIAQEGPSAEQVPDSVQQEILRRSAWSREHPQAHVSLQEIGERLGVRL
jgi:putative addiction module component (TIGR02574 family)